MAVVRFTRLLTTLWVVGAFSLRVQSAEQRPLAEDASTAVSGSPSRQVKHNSYPGLNTSITVHSDTRWPCNPLKNSRSTHISTHQDVCFSANFTIDNHVVLNHPGYCPGGGVPYMAIYPSSDCTGPFNHIDWFDSGRGMMHARCIHSAAFGKSIPPPTGQWSIVFRCETDRASEGAPETRSIFIPPPPPPPPPRPKKPEPTYATVSDSACYVSGLEPPRFLFQHPDADICLSIEPRRELKIYRTATCANGTKAVFAQYSGDKCHGAPVVLKEVTKKMLATNGPATCIDMGPDDWASYAFLCTGDVKLPEKPLPKELFPERKEDGAIRIHYCFGAGCDKQDGSEKQRVQQTKGTGVVVFGIIGLLIVACIIVCCVAITIVSVRYGRRLVTWAKSLFRKEGAIAL